MNVRQCTQVGVDFVGNLLQSTEDFGAQTVTDQFRASTELRNLIETRGTLVSELKDHRDLLKRYLGLNGGQLQ